VAAKGLVKYSSYCDLNLSHQIIYSNTSNQWYGVDLNDIGKVRVANNFLNGHHTYIASNLFMKKQLYKKQY